MSDARKPMTAAVRRAAAIWVHWERRDEAGIEAILDELHDTDAWLGLVMGLLMFGENMVAAAKAGQDRDYLADVLATAAVEEAAVEETP